MATDQKQYALNTVRFFLVFFVLLTFGVIARILWLQYVEGDALRSASNARAYMEKEIPASRGNILADDGRFLATSMPRYNIRMDLVARGLTDTLFRKNVNSLALCLSRFFKDHSQAEYRQKLIEQRSLRNSSYRLGSRLINYFELKELKTFPLLCIEDTNKSGLIVEPEERRLLPLGGLASRTIGSINAGSGVGIEGAYNDYLKGEPGAQIMQSTPGGRLIPVGAEDPIPARDGYDLKTTIDINLQDVVSRALSEQLMRHEAEHGTVVVMEVKSGEIKAIANLTRTEAGDYTEQYNYAVGMSSEPGSTFKLAALIALLEDGKVSLEDTVDTKDGRFRVYDQVITDTKPEGHGVLTVQQVWQVSSNVGVAKLMMKHYQGHAEDFIAHLHAMHLDRKLGLSIEGEGIPYIKSTQDTFWSGVSLPMMSIGYEVKQTPLQVLAFYNAIANDGCMVRPRLVNEILHHGQVMRRFKTEVIDPSICSRETIKQVKQVLQGVVKSGTARNLQTAVYSIAGKTGTAQIARGKEGYRNGGKTEYQASFVGYFPADEPRYSCIVVVNSPTQSGYYGNVVAGPIFREIAEKVYATRSEWFPWYEAETQAVAHLPMSKSGAKQALLKAFDILDLDYVDESGAAQWVNTTRQGDKIVVTPHPIVATHVPNVVGFPLSDALFLLENSGLKVSFRGRGSVKRQSIAPGRPVVKGSRIILEMSVP